MIYIWYPPFSGHSLPGTRSFVRIKEALYCPSKASVPSAERFANKVIKRAGSGGELPNPLVERTSTRPNCPFRQMNLEIYLWQCITSTKCAEVPWKWYEYPLAARCLATYRAEVTSWSYKVAVQSERTTIKYTLQNCRFACRQTAGHFFLANFLCTQTPMLWLCALQAAANGHTAPRSDPEGAWTRKCFNKKQIRCTSYHVR